MIRSELVQKLVDENPHLHQRDVEKIVSTIFEEIINTMAEGDRVELRGFGAFSVKKRDPRIGRNPRTGESVAVEEKHVPFFKTGKLLRDRLNGRENALSAVHGLGLHCDQLDCSGPRQPRVCAFIALAGSSR